MGALRVPTAARSSTPRARIFATADATRRRIERDLHDGAQQQLVSLALELRAAEEAVPPELGELRAELSRVVDGLTSVLDDLREIAHGIHPPILAEGGLGPALKTLARRSPMPVELDVRAKGRLPEPVEVTAYYVVSEALTNAAKHAHASVVQVGLDADDAVVHLSVRDDGVGGAGPRPGIGAHRSQRPRGDSRRNDPDREPSWKRDLAARRYPLPLEPAGHVRPSSPGPSGADPVAARVGDR